MHPAPHISDRPADVLGFCCDEIDAGYGCVLITVIATEGPSSRHPGTQMAVSARGVFAGYVSNGCIDAAIASAALACLETGSQGGSKGGRDCGPGGDPRDSKAAKKLRFGAGSPFMDIKLPCGGALEVLLIPAPARDLLTQMIAELEARRPVSFFCDELSGEIVLGEMVFGEEAPRPAFRHMPDPLITLAGRGSEAYAFIELTAAAGYPLRVLSPDDYILERARELHLQATRLTTTNQIPPLATDPFSALLLLFHDHEWEEPLLRAALEGESFYIGAMGSRKTHQLRLEALYRAGVPPAAAARICGPVGLIPGARDARTMAISALSELIAAYPTAHPTAHPTARHTAKNMNRRADCGL